MNQSHELFPSDARSAAEVYLARGLAPIPLPRESKSPSCHGWQNLRLDHEGLDMHFPPSEARNIGILNGRPSGDHVDVDLDCPEARLAAQSLMPPTGWMFGRPTSPQSHWIYKADRSPPSAQEAFKDLDGSMLVELRGTGGLTVFPPSTHQGTGEAISWHRFTTPGIVSLAELRESVKEVAAASILARHWPPKGSRDSAAMALTGALARVGWPVERVSRFVRAVAVAAQDEEAAQRATKTPRTIEALVEGRNVTGWRRLDALLGQDGAGVVKLVQAFLDISASMTPSKSTVGDFRRFPPYSPFPVGALPSPLREFVTQGASALGTDPSYLALPALAVIASAIGNTRVIKLKDDWTEPSILWTAIVGDSGTLKSPAYNKAVSYLFRCQKRLLEEHQERLECFAQQTAVWKSEQKKPPAISAAPPPQPVFERVVISDITVEKVAEVLEENPRGVLVARDELAGWRGSFQRYKGKSGGSDLPQWLEMFRAGNVVVDRKTGDRRHIFVDQAAASVTGGIQPGVLVRAFTAEFLEAGGAARLIMAMPPKHKKAWTESAVDPAVQGAYESLIDQLLELTFAENEGEKVPHVLGLCPDAKQAWVSFYDAWASVQANVEDELAAAYSKLEGYAARFALLHHVVHCVARGNGATSPVHKESIEAGIALCHWFANETRRIYCTLTETEEVKNLRRLVEDIRRKGGKITSRDLMRSNSAKYPLAEIADTALQSLVEAEIGDWVDQGSAPQGGRPVRYFVLRATPDTTPDETDDEDDGMHLGSHEPPFEPGPGPNGIPNALKGSVSSVRRLSPRDRSSSEGKVPHKGEGGRVEQALPGREYTLVGDQTALDNLVITLN